MKNRIINIILSIFPFMLINTVWVTSGLIVLLSIAQLYYTAMKQYWFISIILLFYTYRYFFPSKPCMKTMKISSSLQEKYPYFKTNKTIFDNEIYYPIKPISKSMLCFHPHGILSCGWTINATGSKTFLNSNVHWLVASTLFKLPFISDFITWHNYGPASKDHMIYLMKNNENLGIIPGGFEEATIFKYNKHRIYLKNRKGFIKFALRYGYKVFPCYTFGEEKTYLTINIWTNIRLYLNKFQIPTVLFRGLWWYFILPFRDIDLNTLIGEPIQFPKINEPTIEEIDKYHKLYIDSLEKLFDKNKKKYCDNPDAILEIY